MAKKVETDFKPALRQTELIHRVGQKAADRVVRGELEFPALSMIERLKLLGVPITMIQGAINDACQETGTETQSFRAHVKTWENGSNFTPLTVRVIGGEKIPGFMPVREGGPVSGRPGFTAVDVYPPQE